MRPLRHGTQHHRPLLARHRDRRYVSAPDPTSTTLGLLYISITPRLVILSTAQSANLYLYQSRFLPFTAMALMGSLSSGALMGRKTVSGILYVVFALSFYVAWISPRRCPAPDRSLSRLDGAARREAPLRVT